MIDNRTFQTQNYSMNAVEVNLEEDIGKTVGRRKAPESARASACLQKTGASLFVKWGRGMPKGVYRYNSHEEAEADWIRHLVKDT